MQERKSANVPDLFTPIEVGPLDLNNRICVQTRR